MYVTYLSKNRRSLNMDVDKEIKKNYDKHVTKVVDEANFNNDTTLRLLSLLIPIFYNHDLTADSYMSFEIPKRNGGTRMINAPCEELKQVQKEILTALNKEKILTHNAVHSFQKHRNCKTAIKEHQKNKSRWFLKLDIADYFGSITPDNLKRELSKNAKLRLIIPSINQALYETTFFYRGSLPQGAVTSPFLSNMYLYEFDYILTNRLKEIDRDFVYTRYADDILISSKKSFRFAPLVQEIQELLEQYNCKLNTTKTRYGSFNGRNWNLGIMYNNNYDLTVGYRAKHLFKNRIHNVITGKNKDPHERNVLKGLYAYYSYIEPEYFSRYKEVIKTL